MSRLIAVVVFAVLGGLALVRPVTAEASLVTCNKTQAPLSIAYAYVQPHTFDLSAIITYGWWNIDPGQCSTWDGFDGSQEATGQATYYFYAHSSAGEWAGDLQLCVDTAKDFMNARFYSTMRECSGTGALRGFRPVGFKTKDATMNLDFIH
jgi:uncharacterized membrane protein